MPLLHFLALSGLYWGTHANYVQTGSCDGHVNNGGAGHSSLDVHLHQAHKLLDHDTLRLDVDHQVLQRACSQSVSNFSATLHLDTLGRHSLYQAANTSVCRTWSSSDGSYTGTSLLYPLSFEVESLPPLSTFSIRLQLESEADQVHECLQADLTPALSAMTSNTLLWMPRVILPFALLAGFLRYRDERTRGYMHAPGTSNLRLPGVGDCLGYMQWIFLSAGLSLHYPGFLQPIASKFSLFSLFLTGPVNHGKVYPGVADGIYSINGTFGGTTGLEHMHQIVGAPSTIDTWVNMVIAILIISVSAALLLEAVAFSRRASKRRAGPSSQESLSARLISRVTAILRIVLSYFTLPLSALSFYQLSASAWLPVWHTVSAAFLVLSIILALIWLFCRLPSRTIGLLMHETPKWYQEQGKQIHHAEKIYVTVLVALTFMRGAIIGGLQALGPVQLSLLAASEICLLFTIRCLRVHPWLSTSTMAPAVRLITTLMMICFVRGLANDSTRTTVGYAIISLHAFTLVMGGVMPAAYNLAKIACKAAKRNTTNLDQMHRPHQLADTEAHSSRLELVSPHEPEDHSRTQYTNDHTASRPGGETSVTGGIASADSPTVQYFRQPRHSSIREHPKRLQAPPITSTPSQKSLVSAASAFTTTTSEIAQPTLIASNRPISPTRSGSSDDDWNDTRSVPLGPRWQDYTYREGDSFYGGTPKTAVESSVASKPALSAKHKSSAALHGTMQNVSGAVSSLRSSIVSALHTKPLQPRITGFEVVRPPRVLESEDQDTSQM